MKIKEVVNFLKKYIKTEKKLFILAMFMITINATLGIFYGFIVGLGTEYVTTESYKIALYTFGIYMIIALIDTVIFERLGRRYIGVFYNKIMEKVSFDVFKKVANLPAKAFEEKTSGELINRVTSDSSIISEALKGLINTFISLLTALAIFIFILFNSWIIALEIVIYSLVTYFVIKKYMPIIKKQQKEITVEKDNTVLEVNETVRGIREIKALGIKDKIIVSIGNIVKLVYKKTNDQHILETNYNSIIYSFSTILEAGVFMTAIILLMLEMVTFAFFISLTYYIYRFMYTTEALMNISSTYQKMVVAIERISEISENKLYKDEKFGNISNTNIKGNIKFDNVSFKYSNEEKNIFDKLNLEIEENKITAIVGKSGQGKSSLFNLLLRYFDVTEGKILIDDISINDFDETSFRKNIAIIRQDPFLFNKTILENFKILDKNITLEDVRKVCKKSQIDEYIMSLPKNYDTVIGEGGINLSGGQKQRVAIARALLKNSKIILFDEATSALDNSNQEKIKEVINSLAKDHTIIVVAHRLTTIENADIIHVVDKGKIVDSGKHKQLVKSSKIYKKLYSEEEN